MSPEKVETAVHEVWIFSLQTNCMVKHSRPCASTNLLIVISIMVFNGKKCATTGLKKPHRQNMDLGNI